MDKLLHPHRRVTTPGGLIDRVVAAGWASACELAREGDPRRLAKLLRGAANGSPPSLEALKLAADLIEGRVVPAKKRGKKLPDINLIRVAYAVSLAVEPRPMKRGRVTFLREKFATELNISKKTLDDILAKKPRRGYSV